MLWSYILVSNWCCIIKCIFFNMDIINFVYCLSALWFNKFSALIMFICVCFHIRWCKSLILTTDWVFLLSHNQYLLKNSLIILTVSFETNSVELFSIFFGIHSLVVLNILCEINLPINSRNLNHLVKHLKRFYEHVLKFLNLKL